MNDCKTILVVDDDPKIATLLKTYLEECGFAVHTVSNGRLCLDFLAHSTEIDAVVLDVMMPVLDGFATLQEIRKTSQIPVVMLTARGDHTDRIVGLELGADDYLAKPFHPRELLARLKAIFRRVQPVQHDNGQDGIKPELRSIVVRNVELWPDRRHVELNKDELSLTGMEFDILTVLMERYGRVVTRDAMMNALKGEDWDVFDRSIDVHISHLRKKLGDASFIKTIRGVGYVVTP
jgi:DNA-binding response OmpR family regulator